MLRLIGALCVIGGAAIEGFRMVSQRRRQLSEWSEMLEAVYVMERELRCREPELEQLLEYLARQKNGPVEACFLACRQGMTALGQHGFAEIWRESLMGAGLSIPGRELEPFLDLGKVLGRYDRETQCAALLRVAEESGERLRRAREALRGQDKLYMTLSIAGGILLVVLAC